jgi:MFS family permease
LSRLVVPVYLPTILFAMGQGLIIPVVPLYVQELGASLGIVGLIVTMGGVGSMLGDVPSGVSAARFGGRRTMSLGAGATALFALFIGLSPSFYPLFPLLLLSGFAFSFWMVARLTYMSDTVPNEYRGRALAMVGGTNRIGMFIGPVAGGFIGKFLGLEAVFFAQAGVVALAGAIIFLRMRGHEGVRQPAQGRDPGFGVVRTLKDNRHSFLTAGSVAVTLVMVRHARRLLIPLWGNHIGLDVAEIGLVWGLASAVDMTLFLPVGVVMDRLGRKFAIVPCLVLLGGSMALVPLTDSFLPFLAVGLLSGFANGLGSGVNMTMGSDLAPREGGGAFLGVWRLIGDVGAAGAPVIVGGLAQVLTIGAAAVATGGVGFAGAAMMMFLVTETISRDKDRAGDPPPAG